MAAASNRVRPANTAEILAHMCLGQGLAPVMPAAAGSQQGYVDVASRRRQREDSDDDGVEEIPPSRRVRLQAEPERIDIGDPEADAARTTSGVVANEPGATPPFSRETSSRQPETEPDIPMETPLEQAWHQRRGDIAEDPGQAFVRALRERPGTVASSAPRGRSRSPHGEDEESLTGMLATASMHEEYDPKTVVQQKVKDFAKWRCDWGTRLGAPSVNKWNGRIPAEKGSSWKAR